jgi:hypothetical protein
MAPAAKSARTQMPTVSHGLLAEPRANVVVESLMSTPHRYGPARVRETGVF